MHQHWQLALTTAFAGSVLFLHAYTAAPEGVVTPGMGVRSFSPSMGQLTQPAAPHRPVGHPSQRTQRAAEGTNGFLARKWPAALRGWWGGGWGGHISIVNSACAQHRAMLKASTATAAGGQARTSAGCSAAA
jgi:hypothetical protein